MGAPSRNTGGQSIARLPSRIGQYAALALATLMILYLLSIPVGLIDKKDRYDTSDIILIIGLIIVLSGAIDRLREITIKPGELNARLDNVEEKTHELGEEQNKLEAQVQALRLALRGVVNVFELDKLRGLASDGPFMVHYHPRLYEEIRELDAKGFVEPVEGCGIIDIKNQNEAHRNDFDLKSYVRLRPQGREYLSLLDKVSS
jgi:hypothetical protein